MVIKRKNNRIALILFATFIFSSLVSFSRLKAQQNTPLYLNESKPVELRVEDALQRMTLEEKVALTHAQSKFSSPGVSRLGIPELWMSDGPNGIREEIQWNSWEAAGWTTDSCTAFPALSCLAATWNPDLSYQFGKAIGEEARYRKKDILLGPGINIYRTPLNGRNLEYMGEDPYLTSKMVVPYIKGVQANGVAACVKHFALNNQEFCRNFINVRLSDRALYEIYLPAFNAAVQEGGVLSIMAAYNKIREKWCAENDFLLKKVLKNDWQFKGVVISDWDALHNTLNGANNGLDLEMGTYIGERGKNYDDYFLGKAYLNALKAGQVSVDDLNDKVRRILTLNFKTAMNRNKPWGSFADESHALIARKVAEEGIVLLQNKESVLPLDIKTIKTIALIGENATRKMTVGGGSSSLKAGKEISPLEGLKNKLYGKVEIKYSLGYSHQGTTEEITTQAIEVAKKADVVLFFGGLSKDEGQDCEGMDRKSYSLPFGQNKLIEELCKVNKKVVIVLISGNAVSMPWIDRVSSIFQAWYGGSEAGNAIANILTGETNPSGKLPFTINKQLNDYGAHFLGAYPGDSVNLDYKEDILVGYRWNDTKKIEPQFCFGYGLSYTNFIYGKAVADRRIMNDGDVLKITVPIKNSGSRKGAEVVQLYIRDLKASVLRPDKELKAFRKIELQPGEEQTVTFEVNKSDLQFYDENMKQWVAEPGRFCALIGSSSRDIRNKIKFDYK